MDGAKFCFKTYSRGGVEKIKADGTAEAEIIKNLSKSKSWRYKRESS